MTNEGRGKVGEGKGMQGGGGVFTNIPPVMAASTLLP